MSGDSGWTPQPWGQQQTTQDGREPTSADAKLIAAVIRKGFADLIASNAAAQKPADHYAGSYRATADDAPRCACKPCEFTGDGS